LNDSVERQGDRAYALSTLFPWERNFKLEGIAKAKDAYRELVAAYAAEAIDRAAPAPLGARDARECW
jgi:hypothetical protein